MKKKIVMAAMAAGMAWGHAGAGVPLRWTVETSRAQPAAFEAYQGETLDFEATLQSYGRPLDLGLDVREFGSLDGLDVREFGSLDGLVRLYWQTNGMGSAWWSKPATAHAIPTPQHPNAQTPEHPNYPNTQTVFRATWTPDCDVGARAYTCFVGITGTVYHAAFQLRLRPSPGAVPNELPLPQRVIDFATVTVLNPPWGGGGGGLDTNAVREIVAEGVRDKRDKGDMAVYAALTNVAPFGIDHWMVDDERLSLNVAEGGFAAWSGYGYAVTATLQGDGTLKYHYGDSGDASVDFDFLEGDLEIYYEPIDTYVTNHVRAVMEVVDTLATASDIAAATNGLATAADVRDKRDKGDRRVYGEDGVKWFKADGTAITLYHVLHNDEGTEGWHWQTDKDWHEGSSASDTGFVLSDAAGDEDELVLEGGGDYYGVTVTRDTLAKASEIIAATNGLAKTSEIDAKIAAAGHVTREEAKAVAAEAVENAVTTYAQTNAVVALNQSVQSVTVEEGQTLTIEAPSGDGAKDWIVYANCATDTPLALPTNMQYYAASEAVTNELKAGITALYFSSCREGIAIGRQELKPILIGE